MNILPVLLNSLSSLFAYVLLALGIYKLMAISDDLKEIRNVLAEVKRERDAALLVAASAARAQPERPVTVEN